MFHLCRNVEIKKCNDEGKCAYECVYLACLCTSYVFSYLVHMNT